LVGAGRYCCFLRQRPVSRSVIGNVAFLHHALIELHDDPVRILEEAG